MCHMAVAEVVYKTITKSKGDDIMDTNITHLYIDEQNMKNILGQCKNDLSSNSFVFKQNKRLLSDYLDTLKDVKYVRKNEVILNKIIEYANKLLDNNETYKANKISYNHMSKLLLNKQEQK